MAAPVQPEAGRWADKDRIAAKTHKGHKRRQKRSHAKPPRRKEDERKMEKTEADRRREAARSTQRKTRLKTDDRSRRRLFDRITGSSRMQNFDPV
jgi:hypothetical protein